MIASFNFVLESYTKLALLLTTTGLPLINASIPIPELNVHTNKELSKLSNYQFKIFDSKTSESKQINNCEIVPTGDDTFFNAILNCKGVICGAGFELPAEVLHLEKKLYVIPIGNQYEQVCNAEALIKMGVESYHKFDGEHILNWIDKEYKKISLNKICKVQDVLDQIN